MISDLVPDDLWIRIAPMLPPPPQRRHRYAGRRRMCDRIALAGIVFVLRTSATWRDVPRRQVGCSGVTAWRRLRDWTEAGVRPRLHVAILAELRAAELLEMDDCAIDGSHVRALKGGDDTGPSPVDRGRPGSKHHVIVDRHGTPLAVSLTGGNRHDVTQLMPLVDAIPRVRGLRGRPRRRLFADRGYDASESHSETSSKSGDDLAGHRCRRPRILEAWTAGCRFKRLPRRRAVSRYHPDRQPRHRASPPWPVCCRRLPHR
ncbi:IS5 family transposase [Nocardia fusca]|uniref:IS5 family transposase n=1 Tax=Nocardia fusca TaxID=941183 RepID=A0ABV3F0I3_9NOCA